MTVQIQDPVIWARSNNYSLKPQGNSRFVNVAFAGNPVGVLIKVGDYFEFRTVDQSTPADLHVAENPTNPNQSGLPSHTPLSGPDTSLCKSESGLVDQYGNMLSQSFGINGFNPIPLSELATKGTNELELSGKISGTGHTERVLDCNYWLPYAAEHYDISRNIRDYVLVPIPAIFSGLPNTNGDSLSLKEMLAFKPEYGMQMYKTFKGQPTHIEHANKDLLAAKGVILESFLRPIHFNKNYWKIVLLLAFDRTKDEALANSILAGASNSYSVGFYYTSYSCSVCGQVVGKGINLSPCSHTQMYKPTYQLPNGQLAFRNCLNAKGFECSAVGTPAFVSAIGTRVMDARKY